ncbi:MAG: hypothetical protein M0D57_11700 [Sphingobacteriales bacterium JAD_PAG50586_3]|nr:MAG: hypothetical protein M0D57_11700 [Sphingobacteriales bacterium JAD_PAG50586_3]
MVSMFVLLSHPLYLLLVPTLFGYFYINNLKQRRFILLGVGLLVLVLVNYQLLTGYNRMSMEVAQYQLKPVEIVKRFFSIRSIIDLVKAYAGIIVLLGVLVYNLFKNKKFLNLYIVAGFVIGYFSLVAYKYGTHYPDTFEPFERYLFIAPLFICVLAVPYLLQTGKKLQYGVLVLVLWHLFYSGKYGMHVKHRYDVLDDAMANAKQFKAGKVYYRAENYYSIINSPRERGHDWIMAMETLLLSSLNEPENTKQVFIKNTLADDFLPI